MAAARGHWQHTAVMIGKRFETAPPPHTLARVRLQEAAFITGSLDFVSRNFKIVPRSPGT